MKAAKRSALPGLDGRIDSAFSSALYFKCRGLFAESFVLDHLPTNGQKVETGNRVIDSQWDSDDTAFDQFFNQVTNTFEVCYPNCKDWNEAQLEARFIRPILESLGFAYDVQESRSHAGRSSRPDYILFSDKSSMQQAFKAKERDEARYWNAAVAVADAKAWVVELDRDGGPSDCPSAQIIRYLDAAGKDWGIITNGRQWRIYYRHCQDRTMKFFEIDLERIIPSQAKYERMKYFFYFFRSQAFTSSGKDKSTFLDAVLLESENYAIAVSNNIKTKVIEIAPLLTEAIHKSQEIGLGLQESYRYALYYSFRLIFVLAAESKGVLDIALNTKYYNLSLRKIAHDLREVWRSGEDWERTSCATYVKLTKLFKVLDQGDSEIGLAGFQSNSYDDCDRRVFNKIEISDHVINSLILELACENTREKKKLFVDFKRISAEHLGGIFETLLEFRPALQNGKVTLEGATDRKDSGSYYTPDYVVDLLVGRALTGFDSPKGIHFLDPACGSGHFLVAAIRALSDAWVAFGKAEEENVDDLRHRIAEESIYGIDRNEVAIALTKLSVFLSVMRKNKPLPKIDDNVKCFDTLQSAKPNHWPKSFEVVVGNPPYVNTKLLSKTDMPLKEYLASSGHYKTCKGCFDLYIPFLERSLDSFVSPGGVVAFVLPNKLMVADYASEIRKLAEQRCLDAEIVDISNFGVFKGIGVYPHLYIFRTGAAKKTTGQGCELNFERATAFEKGKSYATFDISPVVSEVRVPSGKIWSMQKRKRKGHAKLRDICTIEGGIAGYQAQAMIPSLSEGLGKRDKTSDSLVPFIVSGNIDKFRVNLGRVRYMKHDFENPYFDTNAKALTDGKKSLFMAKKIVIAGMTKEIRCAYVNKPLAVGVGVFSIRESRVDLLGLSALLNSLAFTFLYRERFEAKHLAGGYLAINASQLMDADVSSGLSVGDFTKLANWAGKLATGNISLAVRMNYEIAVAELLDVSVADLLSLKVFDSSTGPVLEELRNQKSKKRSA